MQSAQRAPPRTLTRIPDAVESANAKLVYLYLATHDDATLSELQEGLGLTKLTLYSVLGTLREGGVVAREAGRYVPA
jgi:DNA-binding IclR family transcriptional regulator